MGQKEERREKARAEEIRRGDIIGQMRVAFRVDDESSIRMAMAALGVFGPDLKMHEDDEPLLCLATRLGSLAGVKALLDAGASKDVPDKDGFRAIHWAAGQGQEEILAELLARGASVDARNNFEGRTPLMMAARGGHEFCALLLIKCGADRHASDFINLPGFSYATGPSSNAMSSLIAAKESSSIWIKQGARADAMIERIVLAHALPSSSKSSKGPRI